MDYPSAMEILNLSDHDINCLPTDITSIIFDIDCMKDVFGDRNHRIVKQANLWGSAETTTQTTISTKKLPESWTWNKSED